MDDPSMARMSSDRQDPGSSEITSGSSRTHGVASILIRSRLFLHTFRKPSELARCDDSVSEYRVDVWQGAGIPEIDLAHLWLSLQSPQMATGVLTAAVQGRFDDVIKEMIGVHELPNSDLPAGFVVALAWLAHAADGLQRTSRFALGPVWIRQNIVDVLDVFDALTEDQLNRATITR